MIKLLQGDCLEVMKMIPDNSVDMVLADPPYGTTSCKWDSIIPLDVMWQQLRRIIKKNGAIVITADEPYASKLRLSNVEMYKYDWFWRKSRPAGFTNAKLKPLKDIEKVLVFSEGSTANGSRRNMPYFPQGVEDCDENWSRPNHYLTGDKGVNPARKSHKLNRKITKKGYPRQVLDFANSNKNVLHPTQKPVDLMEYLIRTYTKDGETVLDFTMGSGTTGIACINTHRNFIGIELDTDYFKIAEERITNHGHTK